MKYPDEPAIAVIDDDSDVRDVLGVLLEECGHPVRLYKSAPEFLADANCDNVACLIVDQKMPHMSGVQLLAELELRGVHVPSLLITGAHGRDVADGAINEGAMAVLEKPLEATKLLQLVALAVN
jgi:two-component system, LuxR family, response regulator FixJ